MVGDKSRWQRWVETSARSDSPREIARAIGKSHSTLMRKYKEPDVEYTRLVARCFHASMIDGLLAAGILTMEDLGHIRVEVTLRAAEPLELAREVLRRVTEEPETHAALMKPLLGDTSTG